MDKYTGKRLDGRYEIHELIGVGGMAYVYRAYDTIDDRTVAIKILKDEFLGNRGVSSAALRTNPRPSRSCPIPISSRCTTSASATASSTLWMEYIDGITLKEYLDQQREIKWKEAVHFTVQILRALQHAHEQGHCPPGHQAAEHHAVAGRHHQGDGFRHRPLLPQRNRAP